MNDTPCLRLSRQWSAVLMLLMIPAHGAPQVIDFTPAAGNAGTVITVQGTGFGTNAGAVSAKVGGVSAAVVSVAETEVRLNAPAAMGAVEVTVNGESSTSVMPFTATRTVSGTFVPPAGMNAAGYYTGGLTTTTPGLTFSTAVSLTSVEVVWAWRRPNDPMLGALVFPGAANVQIDAASTALMLLTLSPAMPKGDPVAVNAMIARVSGSAELTAMTGLIEQAAAGGFSWGEDQRFPEIYEALLLKAMPPPVLARPPRDLVRPGTGLIRQLRPEHGSAPLRLQYAVNPTADGHLELKVSPSATDPTRLHQNVEVWRVNPTAFPGGFADINGMDFSDRPALLESRPYGMSFVSAKLGSSNLDFGELLSKALSGAVFGNMVKVEGEAKFRIQGNRPAVYVVNSYSGNTWYGFDAVDPGASQAFLINQLDVNKSWWDAWAANVVIGGVDIASVMVPDIKALGSDELGKVVRSITTKTVKAMAAYLSGHGALDTEGLKQISRAAINGLIKALVGIRIGDIAGADWDLNGPVEGYVGGLFKVIKGVLSGTSRLASGLQAAERAFALQAPTHFALERAIVTVGDPFPPAITAFHPSSGLAGDQITLMGELLPNSATGYEVNFITFAGTGAPPPINARLAATVTSATLGTWTIRVPSAAQWEAVFGPGDKSVFLGIRNTATGGESATSANPAPNYQWHYHSPPQLTGVTPNPCRSSGVLTLAGTGFDLVLDRSIYVEIDGSARGSALTVADGKAQVYVSSLTQGQHSLRLVYRNSSLQVAAASNTVNFTVADPYPVITANAPRRIHVTLRNMSNLALDGEISIYEAMAAAAGTLGRNLTKRPEGAEGRWESDWIDFPPGVTGSYGEGSGIRDTIVIHNAATGPQLQSITSALPLPGEGDYVSLGGIIFDGAGTPPGTIGWDLRGVKGNYLEGVEFRDFTGGGIVAGNGAQWNTVISATINNCGGDGVLLSGAASDNYFRFLNVNGAPGAGVRLSGAGVLRNEFASAQSIPLNGTPVVMRVTNCGSHGLLIENGAAGNMVDIWESRGNGGDGIRITGAGTAGNYIGGAAIPGYRDTAGNTGHGMSILAGASATLVENLSAGGNGGDGFLIEGPGTSHNYLRSIATGFDYSKSPQPGFVSRNTGVSVRIVNSAYNAFGTGLRGNFINTPECSLGGSSGGPTVLITGAGSHHNTMDTANFGFMEPYASPGTTPANLLLAPAATHALHITGGAHDNEIGHATGGLGVKFLGVPDGAAILIEGGGTDNNRVLGCTFGLNRDDIPLTGQQVRRGVHLLNGPRGNRIGEVGNQLFVGSNLRAQPYNSFGAIVEAGIRLEGLSSTIDGQGNPTDANVVINNRMGFTVFGGTLPPQHPEVGVHLKNSVTGQWIGSLYRSEGNQFSRYGYAALWIENGTIQSYAERNRIASNWANVGVGTSGTAIADPFAGPLAAQAVLITGGANQVVGEDIASYNQWNGSRLCVYIEGGSNHWLRGNDMDRGLKGSVFVHNGTGHRIGGPGNWKNRITRSGTAGDNDTAAITLAGGGTHRLENNTIGDFETVDTIWGSRGHGILIHESANNHVGGTANDEGNLIARSAGHGILVRGAASAGNQIGSNRIGIGTQLSPNPGNLGDGIQLTGGANNNLIGGELAPLGLPGLLMASPNTIHGNTGHGVHVDGAATVGNRILRNSIANNGGKGIAHTAAGNHLQPPPDVVHLEKGRISGSVNLATTPAGSRIEAFMNVIAPNPEGDIWLNSGLVKADGTYSFPANFVPAGSTITATATHAVTGDTSEFTIGTVLPPETFGFSLEVPQGESSQTRSWPAGAPFSAVVLTAATDSASVEVRKLRVKALGTGGFAAALAGVSLFEDVDRDGQFSAPDRTLAPVTAFTAGEAELELNEALVSDGEQRRWVLRLHPNGAPDGTVRLEVSDANAVDEFYWEPLGASGVRAIFPLQSALYQAGGGPDPRAAWRTSFGLPADGSGNGADLADPDKDGLVNLLEYALGSSPVDGKDAARPTAARAASPDRITFTYQKLRADVIYTVEAAAGLSGPWSASGVDQGGAGPAVTASVPVSGGRKFLRLRVQ